MDQQRRHILLIDDDEDDYLLIRERLSDAGSWRYQVSWASTLEAGKEAMDEHSFDAVLVDYRLGVDTGIDLIRAAVARSYPAPILLLTGQGNLQVDLEAMQAGAADYLNKSEMNSSLLERSIRYAIERKQHEDALRRSEQALRASESRFRIALANTKITVFSTDEMLRYTWVFSAMMGPSAEEYIGKSDEDFLAKKDAALLMALKRRALEEETPVLDEVIIHMQEERKELIVSIEPFVQSNGSISGVIGAYYDVTEERRMERERSAHRTEMEVQRRLTEHRERERQAIARELHDGPVQSLSSLIFGIQYIKDGLEDESVKLGLENIRSSLRDNVNNLRELMNELRPPSLIRFGVGRAIQYHLESFREKHPDLNVELNINVQKPDIQLSEQVNLNLYRIYSEAMANIARHSLANRVSVELEQLDHQVKLEIHDNGKGFPTSADLSDYTENNHFGLAVMKERAEMIDGQFYVMSESERGTTILVVVKLSD
jgi:PAS domain S-box-containing protein